MEPIRERDDVSLPQLSKAPEQKEGIGLAAIVMIGAVFTAVPTYIGMLIATGLPGFIILPILIPVALTVCAIEGFRRECRRRNIERLLQATAGLAAAAGLWVVALLPFIAPLA